MAQVRAFIEPVTYGSDGSIQSLVARIFPGYRDPAAQFADGAKCIGVRMLICEPNDTVNMFCECGIIDLSAMDDIIVAAHKFGLKFNWYAAQ